MELLILWVVIAVVVVGIDILTSAFLFCWFGIGAIAAIICNLLDLNFTVQFITFTIVSLIAISIGYPWTKKVVKKSIKHTPLMEETYIGKILTAENDIENTGIIKVGGNFWTAHNVGGKILKGQKFQITGIEGTKLVIKSMREE